LIVLHYMHVWKYHNVQLIYTKKNSLTFILSSHYPKLRCLEIRLSVLPGPRGSRWGTWDSKGGRLIPRPIS
jgi:hypothetical protein